MPLSVNATSMPLYKYKLICALNFSYFYRAHDQVIYEPPHQVPG